MFAADRITKIKEILLEYKHIDVNSLCSVLGCSVATVRRDIDRLETEGFLKKTYGGAILTESQLNNTADGIDNDPYHKEKLQIAMIAAEMVHNNDVIFLGPGKICQLTARYLKEKENLRIITNNLNIVMEVAGIPGIRIILLGGDITGEDSSLFTVGRQAEEALNDMLFNKVFFTADGVSIEYGCTLNNYDFTLLLRKVIGKAGETILITDESKFGKNAFVKAMELKNINKVVTNIGISAEYKEYLFNNQIELFTTFEDI